MNYFADHASGESLARQSVRGGAASVLGRATMGVLQVGAVLILARLLSPEDYGLVAMATAIVCAAPIIVDLGTRDAVVQKAQITEGEVSALFWLTLSVGLVLSALTAAASPLIAHFYGEPRLTTVVLISSLIFIAAALTSQHQALLRRALKFRELATIDVIANLLSAAIAIAMAFRQASKLFL